MLTLVFPEPQYLFLIFFFFIFSSFSSFLLLLLLFLLLLLLPALSWVQNWFKTGSKLCRKKRVRLAQTHLSGTKARRGENWCSRWSGRDWKWERTPIRLEHQKHGMSCRKQQRSRETRTHLKTLTTPGEKGRRRLLIEMARQKHWRTGTEWMRNNASAAEHA